MAIFVNLDNVHFVTSTINKERAFQGETIHTLR